MQCGYLHRSYEGDDCVKQVRYVCKHWLANLSHPGWLRDDRVQAIINQINIDGEDISDARVVQIVIRSLNSDFDNVASSIEEAHDLSTLSIKKLLGSLSSHK